MQKIQILNAEETSIRQSLAEISFHTTLFIFFSTVVPETSGLLLRILSWAICTLWCGLKMNTQLEGKLKIQEDGTQQGQVPSESLCISLNNFYPELSCK